jgi:hypothetical protein
MPKLTHTKRTTMVGLAMTGAVVNTVQNASADSNTLEDLNQHLKKMHKQLIKRLYPIGRKQWRMAKPKWNRIMRLL